jgi:hypothetical protein
LGGATTGRRRDRYRGERFRREAGIGGRGGPFKVWADGATAQKHDCGWDRSNTKTSGTFLYPATARFQVRHHKGKDRRES